MTTLNQTGITHTEFVRSFTGFDKLAVAKAFGVHKLTDIPDEMMPQAVAFVLARRQLSQSDTAAYQTAMSLPDVDIQALFTDTDTDDEAGPTFEMDGTASGEA